MQAKASGQRSLKWYKRNLKISHEKMEIVKIISMCFIQSVCKV